VCDEGQRERLLSRVRCYYEILKTSTFGKHIVNRLEKLLSAGMRIQVNSITPTAAVSPPGVTTMPADAAEAAAMPMVHPQPQDKQQQQQPQQQKSRGVGSAVLDTGAVLIESATSVRAADEALRALAPLIPGFRYSRIAPGPDPRCSMDLDEVDRSKWREIEAAADEYARGVAKRELDEVGAILREAWGE